MLWLVVACVLAEFAVETAVDALVEAVEAVPATSLIAPTNVVFSVVDRLLIVPMLPDAVFAVDKAWLALLLAELAVESAVDAFDEAVSAVPATV